jgi:hypothetical protein
MSYLNIQTSFTTGVINVIRTVDVINLLVSKTSQSKELRKIRRAVVLAQEFRNRLQ